MHPVRPDTGHFTLKPLDAIDSAIPNNIKKVKEAKRREKQRGRMVDKGAPDRHIPKLRFNKVAVASQRFEPGLSEPPQLALFAHTGTFGSHTGMGNIYFHVPPGGLCIGIQE
ncbi:hypothetical protein NHX12_029662 [Muraenolepis orangiensis]|uniref:Uncharacterized protein n=1 Tax=Muraenolepis orangiensis TaxID=630683 RepID=A0A9Q0IM05_9TELE|nr:hypothetical protein NHX12_029662 [Muraenolepis orangiensis]